VIHAKRVRKQKTDRPDAQLILRLVLKDDFPQIWVPSWENHDLRQLPWHRQRMMQARTRIWNQLQAVAINEGLRSNMGSSLVRGKGNTPQDDSAGNGASFCGPCVYAQGPQGAQFSSRLSAPVDAPPML
jgi:hypothetical protein